MGKDKVLGILMGIIITTHFSDEARVVVLTLYLYTTILIPLSIIRKLFLQDCYTVGYFTASVLHSKICRWFLYACFSTAWTHY